jgi:predicted acyltransferase
MPEAISEAVPPAVSTAVAGPPRRLASLDALRGFDMFWIIGADALFRALNKIGDGNPAVGAVANQLEHVAWEGFCFYDLIFPMFVFIVGVSIVFALSRRVDELGRGAAVKQIFRRFAILYLLGIFSYGGIERGFENIRLLGVLQRIAICYLCGALAFLYLKPRGLLALCVSLLVGYWALMTFVPVPGVGAGNFAEGKNLANYLDAEFLPLFKWDGNHDPEGLLSTLPAIGTCLLGILAGLLLRKNDPCDRHKLYILASFGLAGVLIGNLWSLQFPIIKKIWSSSFVLVAGGYSALLLAAFYFIIDMRKHERWATPFLWIGTNAITIYMLVHIVKLESMAARIVGGEVKTSLDAVRNGLGDLLIALLALGMAVWFCRFLYQRRIFLKI